MLPIALALAQFAPMIAGLLGGPKAEDVASKVVGVAQSITGQSSPDAALAALQSDPNLSFQFQKAILDNQFEIEKLAQELSIAELQADSANVAVINQTMQAETKSEHWASYTWRPFIGFCYGVEGVMTASTVMASYVGVMFFKVDPAVLSYIPPMLGAMVGIMGVQSAVLGIASYFRGKMQAGEARSLV